jgi:hypothetical protein
MLRITTGSDFIIWRSKNYIHLTLPGGTFICYSKPMKKLLPLLLFFIFAYDIAVDSFDADCISASDVQACHTCLCQNHFTNPATVASSPVVARPELMAQADFIPSLSLSDKSFFHPPKILA